MVADAPQLRPPAKLSPTDAIAEFDSGYSVLDDWLKRRALRNDAEGASRTYVVCAGETVVGYYCLANGAVAQTVATGKVRRNMPDPIPVMVIGRLAVDRRWQGRGIGKGLLRDAVLRTMQAAEIAGIRAILVHAIDEEAKQFYERYGFVASNTEPLTLMLQLKDAVARFSPA